jgi:hypothetical protein
MDLEWQDMMAVNEQIWRGEARWIRDTDRKGVHYAVNVAGREMPIVYHTGYHSVVTVLPLEADPLTSDNRENDAK